MVLYLTFELIPFFLEQSEQRAFWICLYWECSPFLLFRTRVPGGVCLVCVLEQPSAPCHLWHMESPSTALAGPWGRCSAQLLGCVKTAGHVWLPDSLPQVYDLLKTEGNWWRVRVAPNARLLSASDNDMLSFHFFIPRILFWLRMWKWARCNILPQEIYRWCEV